MTKIEVKTDPPYEVWVGVGALDKLGEAIVGYSKVVLVTDDKVYALHRDSVERKLLGHCVLTRPSVIAPYIKEAESKDGLPSVFWYVFPSGERYKTHETLLGIYHFLVTHEVTRSDVLVAIGGGVVGDVAAFAAATYLRGIDCIQVPTTLLAMVDSSVGGKTAVNLPEGKNLVGCFCQPKVVLDDLSFLQTLPHEEFVSGLGEVVKYAAIADKMLFDRLETGKILVDESLVVSCIRIKANLVALDTFDCGLRQLLNFGHTLGHAIEKLSNFTVSHGKAVAMGMLLMTKFSENKGWTPVGTAKRLQSVCTQMGLPITTAYSKEELAQAILCDKKRLDNTLTVIVLEEVGQAIRKTIDLTENLNCD